MRAKKGRVGCDKSECVVEYGVECVGADSNTDAEDTSNSIEPVE